MLRKKPRIELLRVVKNKNHNWKQTIKFKAWFFGHDAIMRFMTNSIIIHMHFFLYASSTISIFEKKSELIWMKLDFHRLLPAHPQALLQLTEKMGNGKSSKNGLLQRWQSREISCIHTIGFSASLIFQSFTLFCLISSHFSFHTKMVWHSSLTRDENSFSSLHNLL